MHKRVQILFAAVLLILSVLSAPASAHSQSTNSWVYFDPPSLCIGAYLTADHGSGGIVAIADTTSQQSAPSCPNALSLNFQGVRVRQDLYKSTYPNAQICVAGFGYDYNPTSGPNSWYAEQAVNYLFTCTKNFVVGVHQWYAYPSGWGPNPPHGTLIAVT